MRFNIVHEGFYAKIQLNNCVCFCGRYIRVNHSRFIVVVVIESFFGDRNMVALKLNKFEKKIEFDDFFF